MVGEVSRYTRWMYFAAGEAADWDDHCRGSDEVIWDVESFLDGFVGF